MFYIFHTFCFIFVFLKTVNSSFCDKNTLPFSIKVNESDDLILECSKPKFSIIQRNRYEFFKNESWHLNALNYKLCSSNFTSDQCNGSNGEWISGINSLKSKNLNVTCCYNDDLKLAKHLKDLYIEKGQKIQFGDISKNGSFIGFAYISNIMKIVNYDRSVTYKISVNGIQYLKTRLQIHSFNTTNAEKTTGDSKKESESSISNDDIKEENLNSIESGICDKKDFAEKNATGKPCSSLPSRFLKLKQNSNLRSTASKNIHPFSRRLYQAPLRPGQVLPSESSGPSEGNAGNDDSEIIKDEDFSIDFGGGDQCPFNDDTEASDGEAGESNGESANANSNSNANSNGNGNSNLNSQSSSNQNPQSSNNVNSQSSTNQNSQTNSNQNSQSNNIQNSQSNNNQNSESASNQNSQTNNNQNIQNNINQNSQINIVQNPQLQNVNPQIIQPQNPINPFVMPMPNVPFVQNPVNPPVVADYGQNNYANFAGMSDGACFAGDTEVQVLNGNSKRMDELEVNDWIYSAGDVKFGFSRIISWLHRMPKEKHEFFKITLENGKSLKITSNHYIYKAECFVNQSFETLPKQYVEAANLQISDCLLHLNDKNQLLPTRIINLENIFEEGIYAPLTDSGNIFVNGILASCYSEIDSHSLLSILPKLNKYFKAASDLFRITFLEPPNSQFKYKNEIDLIPGIEMLMKTIKSNLYPNYQKNEIF